MADLLTRVLKTPIVSMSLLALACPGTAWSQDEEEDESIVVDLGIDTTLAETGLFGPSRPHGENHPDGSLWEFDSEDGGGQNQGLIWFDIPKELLAGYNDGEAVLQLHVVNSGHAANLHRVTANWLDLGDSVTWNDMPDGPGIVVGSNAAESTAQFPASFASALSVVEVDVSQDVLAWSRRVSNYGWAFLPTDTNGTTITSFESQTYSKPTLVITPGEGPFLQAGDADRDFDFDQLDLVKVQIAAKYLSGHPATWGEGDWNGAPGGSADDPPPGDGTFNQLDIISAVSAGIFLTGPYVRDIPLLQAGDADQDLDFDQLDLVQVQIAARYLSGRPATWGQGDWNGAPGGSPDFPPPGDGVFNQLDIISAVSAGIFLTGPYAALETAGTRGDGQTSIGYDANTGEVFVDAPDGAELTSINIDSASGVFFGDPAQGLGGSFDNDSDNNIFKATFGSSFGSLSFGNVAPPGLSEPLVLNDLTVLGSLAGGGDLGDVDLIYVPVPEPSTVLLLGLSLLSVACRARRQPHR